MNVAKCSPKDWPCVTIMLSKFNNSVILEFLAANWIAYYFIKRKNFPRLFKTGKLFIVDGHFTFYMLNWPEQMEITAYVCFTFRKKGGRNPYMLQSFKARLDKKDGVFKIIERNMKKAQKQKNKTKNNIKNKKIWIPIGCVSPACCPYLPACTAQWGGVCSGGCIPACTEAAPPCEQND